MEKYLTPKEVKKKIAKGEYQFHTPSGSRGTLILNKETDKIYVCIGSSDMTFSSHLLTYWNKNIPNIETDIQWVFWEENGEKFLSPYHNCDKIFTATFHKKKEEESDSVDFCFAIFFLFCCFVISVACILASNCQ